MIFKITRSGEDYKTIIIHGQFESMNASLFENSVCMETSLKIAEVEPNNIKGIIIVGGVICLVNSDNERDSVLLNRSNLVVGLEFLLRGTGDY